MLLLVVISSADSTPNKVGPSVNNDGSESGSVSDEQPRLSNMGGHGELVEERELGTGAGAGAGAGGFGGTGGTGGADDPLKERKGIADGFGKFRGDSDVAQRVIINYG